MMKKLVLKYGYFLGIISQLILILILMSLLTDVNEIFRYAARFSGRFSFSLYLISLLSFLKFYTKNHTIVFTKKVLGVFSLIHLIHFCFLVEVLTLGLMGFLVNTQKMQTEYLLSQKELIFNLIKVILFPKR